MEDLLLDLCEHSYVHGMLVCGERAWTFREKPTKREEREEKLDEINARLAAMRLRAGERLRGAGKIKERSEYL